MKIFFSHLYNATKVAFDTTRKALAVAASLLERPIAGVELVEPAPLTTDEVELAHHRDYILALIQGTPAWMARSNGIGWDENLFTAVLHSNGGLRDAVLLALLERRHAGSLSSGLHHAKSTSGNGYCTINGLAIAAIVALRNGAKRVLILDLDAHCGGGTASIIEGIAGIEQVDVSVSSFDRYENTDNATLVMSSGETYLGDVSDALAAIVDPAQIDVVIYNAGMDPHHQAGGVQGITTAVLAERERMVFEWAGRHGLPVAWTLAGGYQGPSLGMDGVVDLHRLTIEAAMAATTASA